MKDLNIRLSNTLVALRRYRPADAAAHSEAVSESWQQIAPWMQWAHADFTAEESLSWINSLPVKWTDDKQYDFAIVSPKDDSLLGGCSLHDILTHDKVASLAYWIRPSRAGMGLATAAASLLVRFGFDTAGLNRIQLIIGIGNAPSIRVAQKLKAVQEGVLRNRYMVAGKSSDAIMFSLVKDSGLLSDPD